MVLPKLPDDASFLDYIMRTTEKNGAQPTVRELCDAFGVSINGVNTKIRKLRKNGWIGPHKFGTSRNLTFLRWPCGVEFRGFRDSHYTSHQLNLIWGFKACVPLSPERTSSAPSKPLIPGFRAERH